ncbi:MAG: hypothetical protein J6R85_05615, partial [Lentisphaeria bacterium]|nr:hypothetical protein [Lentisphaeria bacterium]
MVLCPDSNAVFQVVSGGMTLRLGGTVCDHFPEEMALTTKARSHISADCLEGSAELRRQIPFGCEYTVSRRMEFFDGAARFSVDVRAGNGGRLRNLELDPVEFRGAIRRIGIAGADGTLQWQDAPQAETAVYDDAFAPLWIAVECADGSFWETGCGDDLWRHRPQMEGNAPRVKITASAEKITLQRTLLALPEEMELERRPWRWEYWIAWSRPAASLPEKTADAAALPETAYRMDASGARQEALCLLASPVRSRLRDLVRKASDDVVLTDLNPG